MERKMDVLVDLQFGSTGKGLLAGYLSSKNGYDVVVSCNMPNAGHTAYCPITGEKFVHKVLPSGIFSPNLRVIGVGPGAVFSIDQLEKEWRDVCEYFGEESSEITLVIHNAAGILTPEHKATEQATLSRISSTMQGSAEALVDKIRRKEGATAKYKTMEIHERMNQWGKCVVVGQTEWMLSMAHADNILIEGSQGYSLSISAGFYPFCTSRDCTPARVIADCSMPIGYLRDVYGCARVHPIRVGNTPDGYSGDWYDDQKEIHFSDLGVDPELTTVTQRVRRIATFSYKQIYEAMEMANPTAVFLNFANYDQEAANQAQLMINSAAAIIGCGGVKMIGYGPLPGDLVEVI